MSGNFLGCVTVYYHITKYREKKGHFISSKTETVAFNNTLTISKTYHMQYVSSPMTIRKHKGQLNFIPPLITQIMLGTSH